MGCGAGLRGPRCRTPQQQAHGGCPPPGAAMQAQPHQYSCCVAAEPGSSWHGAGCSRSAGGLGCHPAACPQPSAPLPWPGTGCRVHAVVPGHPAACRVHGFVTVPCPLPVSWKCCVGPCPRTHCWREAWGLPASGTCCSPVATSPWAWRGLLCPDLLPASARGWCLTAPSVLGSRPSVPSCRGVLAALPAPGPC